MEWTYTWKTKDRVQRLSQRRADLVSIRKVRNKFQSAWCGPRMLKYTSKITLLILLPTWHHMKAYNASHFIHVVPPQQGSCNKWRLGTFGERERRSSAWQWERTATEIKVIWIENGDARWCWRCRKICPVYSLFFVYFLYYE